MEKEGKGIGGGRDTKIKMNQRDDKERGKIETTEHWKSERSTRTKRKKGNRWAADLWRGEKKQEWQWSKLSQPSRSVAEIQSPVPISGLDTFKPTNPSYMLPGCLMTYVPILSLLQCRTHAPYNHNCTSLTYKSSLQIRKINRFCATSEYFSSLPIHVLWLVNGLFNLSFSPVLSFCNTNKNNHRAIRNSLKKVR